MKTGLILGLALGACASVALAEPLPPAGSADGATTPEAHPTRSVHLTEAQMDNVTAGGRTGLIAKKLPMTRMYSAAVH